jgi:hypothetical protein
LPEREGYLRRTLAELLDEHRVPVVVQISGALAASADPNAVTARVSIVGGMQGLVQIPDEVQQELQRPQPLASRRDGRCQLRLELIDLVHDTVARRTVAGR